MACSYGKFIENSDLQNFLRNFLKDEKKFQNNDTAHVQKLVGKQKTKKKKSTKELPMSTVRSSSQCKPVSAVIVNRTTIVIRCFLSRVLIQDQRFTDRLVRKVHFLVQSMDRLVLVRGSQTKTNPLFDHNYPDILPRSPDLIVEYIFLL